MSDKPQPQQSSQGWVPREPEPAPQAAPGGPGSDGAPGDPGGTDAPGKAGKKARRKRTGWGRLIPTWRMVLGTFLGAILLVIGLFTLGYYLVKIPPANAAATKQSNVYLYADGSQLARDGEVNRENVTLAQISKDAQHAALAAEDRDFYTESAVDPKAMIRAGWNTVTGKGKQSGSTITQQYVKNYYLGQEQTATRKVKEFFISIKLDRRKSKDDILEGYLNTSYYGRNAYGIQAAAQAYYGVDAKNLTIGQGAYLAALLNAPSEYDVVAHPENKSAAVARWNYVLDGMVKKNWLTRADRAKVTFPQPKQEVVAAAMSGQRGYLVQAVKDYLVSNKIIDEDTLTTGGYRITTTLQKSRQNAFVKAVDDQVMSNLDKKNRKVDRYVRAGGVSIDPATGKVVAMYGGIDYTKQYVNNATRRDYQVGSTFKPLVFTSAVQNGSQTQDGRTITPNTVYDGTNKRPVQGWNGGSYAPENEDKISYGPITVRTATDKSVNAVYAQMAVDVGPGKVKQTAEALGIPANTPDLTATPSIALGPSTASVLDMAEAYATLANHGKHGTYTLVEKVTKDGTSAVSLPKQDTEQAVTREAADTTTSILQSVVEGGTGTAALAAGRPAAGKTGTAEEDQAAWFAGYTPDLATVVSVMGQDPDTGTHESLYGALGQARINGGGYPAQIWAQYTKAALKGSSAKDFDLQLQPGAEEQQLPSAGPTDQTPGTGGQDNGGQTTGGTATQSPPPDETQGQTQGQTDGQTQGQTEGQIQGQTQGQTDGGTTTGGGTTDGTTTGGTTDAGTTTGGDTAAPSGGTTDGGGTAGTTAGAGPLSGLTSRKQ
ncbi:transglycosylase domain-containing protein [Streptomyces sp. RLB1-33]|uniref:transglycosylase domain-containing protein n=1 Tax=Streptomyces mirabilis TaxID=68239 RepID=UPI00143EB31B|nr:MULTISPECIES: transglycosylase domain-containing protein [Streptomyces]QIY71313.1 penicillin-binding protein [Streptomyces sp. RLB1-33]QUW81727.1 penicillin-binding protein [Streptomyces mirabilis]